MYSNGPAHGPIEDINQIRSLLLKGDINLTYVLKELVQNADDSKARWMTLGYSSGIPQATHPILQDPAIFVVNEDGFSLDDAIAIRSIGSSSKPASKDTVGKFGLGMKTVFYLCEVFFYQASQASSLPAEERAGILNLWDSKSKLKIPRTDWDSMSFDPQDQRLMRSALAGQDVPDGFTLWLPLRIPRHGTRADPPPFIHPVTFEKYPEELSGQVLKDLVTALPLLQSLEHIELVSKKERTVVSLKPGSTRRSLNDQKLTGQVVISGAEYARYSGEEVLVPEMRRLIEHQDWPKVFQADLYEMRPIKEKGEPHLGVVFFKSQARQPGQGKFRVEWSVFLPVSQSPYPEAKTLAVGGDWDFTLNLHGFFFLGADRRSIMAWEDREQVKGDERIRRTWNHSLQTHILNRILPNLQAFCQHLQPGEVDQLTRALKASVLFERCRAEMCATRHWIKTYQGITGTYRLLGVEARVFSLPSIPKDIAEVFPNWEKVTQSRTICSLKDPSLSTLEPTVWAPSDLQELLLNVDLKYLLANEKQFKFFVECVGHAVRKEDRRVLRPLLNQLLSVDLNVPEALRDEIRTLLKHFETRFYLPGPWGPQSRKELRQVFSNLNLRTDWEVLLVPDALKESSHKNQLSVQQAHLLLSALSGQDDIQTMVQAVAGSVDAPDKQKLREQTATLLVVQFSTTDNQTVLLSVEDLEGTQVYQGSQRSRAWRNVLRPALQGFQALFVSEDTLKAFGVTKEPLEGQAALKAIMAHRFSELDRKPVMEELLKEPVGDLRKQALRYTLHGSFEHCLSEEELWHVSSSEGELEKFGQLVLQVTQQEWCLVPSSLVDCVPVNQHPELLLVQQSAESMARKIDNNTAAVAEMVLKHFTAEQRLTLAKVLPASTARRLPLVTTTQGKPLVVADHPNRVFIEGGVTLPRGFQVELQLIPKNQAEQAGLLSVTRLRPFEALDLALQSKHPAATPAWVLNQLQVLDEHLPLPPTLSWRLRTTAWLKDHQGQPVAPQNILDFPELSSLLEEVLQEQEVELWSASEVDCTPEGLEVLRKRNLLPASPSRMDHLTTALSTPDGRFHVGTHGSEVDLDVWMDVFSNHQAIMPLVGVLGLLNDQEQQKLFEDMRKPVPTVRVTQILAALSAPHPKWHSAEHEFHRSYLQQAVDDPHWTLGPDLLLLAQSLKWTPAGLLCAPTVDSSIENVDEGSLLHPVHHLVLKKAFPVGDHEERAQHPLDGTGEPLHQVFSRYFRGWEATGVPRELIGAFLSLFRQPDSLGGRELRSLVENYMGDRDPHLLTRGFQFELSRHRDYVDQSAFRVSLSSNEDLQVSNLLGETIQVPKRKHLESIFAGEVHPGRFDGAHFVTDLALHPLDPLDFTLDHLRSMLKRSAEVVLQKLCLQRHLQDFDELWESLSHSEQFALRFTQKIIIQDSIVLSKQLKLPPAQKRLFTEWDQLRRDLQEAEENPPKGKEDINWKKINTQLDIEKLQKKVTRALEDPNDDLSRQFLAAVKQRVKDAQYQQGSILFELFQNADDALAELAKLQELEVRPEVVVVWDEDSVDFIHWGRKINQAGVGTYMEESFKGDLQKMLMLNASDKGTADGLEGLRVTGKFGLGFKSVFLATDHPSVLSGQMAFTVSGGIYPGSIDQDLNERLRDRRKQWGDVGGTLIHLPLQHASCEVLVGRFQQLVPYMLPFSQSVRQVKLQERTVTHEKQSLTDQVHLLHFQPASEQLRKALLVATEHGAMLIKLGPQGLMPIDPQVPTYWVTTPTVPAQNFGVVLNADFAIDIGRSQLAHTQENQRLGEDLAQEWFEALRDFHAFTSDWASFQNATGLGKVSPYGFWASFWKVLVEQCLLEARKVQDALAQTIFWNPQGGAVRRLFEQCQVVPNGLPGGFAALVCLKGIKQVFMGLFSEAPESLKLVENWPSVQLLDPARCMSSQTHQTLCALGWAGTSAEITLLGLMQKEVGATNHLTPRVADRILPLAWQVKAESTEHLPIQHWIKDLFLTNEEGHKKPIKDLVIPLEDTDQDRVAGFAPREAILSQEYSTGIREALQGWRGVDTAEDGPRWASWAMAAKTTEIRRVVLLYLLDGEYRTDLIQNLKGQLKSSWLGALTTEAAFLSLSADQRLVLLGQLGLSHLQQQEKTAASAPAASTQQDPAARLQRLYIQWELHKKHLLSNHDKLTYPSFWAAPQLKDQGSTSQKMWLCWFLLASYQRFGRTKPEQHKDFLLELHTRRWLDRLLTVNQQDSLWFEVIDEYLQRMSDNNDTYYQWMGNLLPTYQFSKYLQDYVQVLQDHNNRAAASMAVLLRPNNDWTRSGSGSRDIPPLERPLGIGAHWLLRELLRKGVMQNPALHRLAFVPNKQVLNALKGFGFEGSTSEEIHAFLVGHLGKDKAHFKLAFDLPFRHLEDLRV